MEVNDLGFFEDMTDLPVKTPSRTKKTPEKPVMEPARERIEETVEDSLLQLAGIFESDCTDISARHDAYIGEGLRGDY